MRRATLAPPRPAVLQGASGDPSLQHAALAPPAPAASAPRRFFDPVAGWFRRLERATSLGLSRRVFPRVPGIEGVYESALRRHLTVCDAEVAVPGLPPAFDGCTILLVTDIHAGPFLSRRALGDTFGRLAALSPDAIVLGGDLVTTSFSEILPHAETLASLQAPLGVWAVLGNHDHYAGAPDLLRSFLHRAGVRLLRNEAAILERDGEWLALAGVDDWNAGSPDLDAALREPHRIGRPAVLLSHNPDAFFAAARRGVPLVLSGHTHGGQVRIPGLPVLVRMSRYRLDEGRYAVPGSEVVVSRGIGVSGLPVRWGCPPEAVLVTLRPGGKRAR